MYIEKHTLPMIIQDVKAKREALSLAYEQLKNDNDTWNKTIIILSLMTGSFESTKLKMGWTNDLSALAPIALNSIIASIPALIRLKKIPEQFETILQAQLSLTHTLNKA
jgi:hypothetical protein